MAKNRKTREQKKLADLRHQFKHQIVPDILEVRNPTIKIKPVIAVQTDTAYPYLAKDLTMTLMLTATIIGVQAALFIFLKTHLITIPGLLY
jgi:hypothetical protein